MSDHDGHRAHGREEGFSLLMRVFWGRLRAEQEPREARLAALDREEPV